MSIFGTRTKIKVDTQPVGVLMSERLPPCAHTARSVIPAQGHLPDPEGERVFSGGVVRAFCRHSGLHIASGSPGVPGRPAGQSHPQTLSLQDRAAQETSVSVQGAGPYHLFL